jgi:hypothetical protein
MCQTTFHLPVGQAKAALGGSCVQIDFANQAVTAAPLAAD